MENIPNQFINNFFINFDFKYEIPQFLYFPIPNKFLREMDKQIGRFDALQHFTWKKHQIQSHPFGNFPEY